MNISKKNLLAIVFLVSLNLGRIFGQNDTIFKAMRDELKRNFSELSKQEDFVPPCFIGFNLSDYEYKLVRATMGSVSNISDGASRNSGMRILIGDYSLSDENFNDNANRPNHNDGNFVFPMDNDYLSIRRAFWIMANNVFKNASEKYKNKISAMELKGLTREDLPADDFSHEKSVVHKEGPITGKYDEQAIIEKTKQLSSVFMDYPDIQFSQISIFYINSLSYMVNSEESEISLPFQMYFIHVAAIMPDQDNHSVWLQLGYYSKTLDGLPKDDIIKKDIRSMADDLYDLAKAENFSDKYIGPLFLEDFAALEYGFMRLFSGGNEGLLATRPPVVNNNSDGLVIPNLQTWENRFDKRVLDKKISIMDMSPMENYKGQKLFGSYKIDIEGVQPKDSLVLINKGILKSQLVSRTPTSKQNKSTGHMRLGLTEQGIMTTLSPGVVSILSDETVPSLEMKNKLLELGTEEGLDYVICARPIKSNANISTINYYKIDITTGKEELVRGVRYSPKLDDLREISFVSDNQKIYNTLFYGGAPGTRGVPVTFISPDGIIIKETNISGDVNTIKGELPIVPSPLMMMKAGE